MRTAITLCLCLSFVLCPIPGSPWQDATDVLAPQSLFETTSEGKAQPVAQETLPFAVTELTNPKDMPAVFDLLAKNVDPLGQIPLAAMRSMFDGAPEQFMRKTTTFAARDLKTGELLGVAMVDLKADKHRLRVLFDLPAEAPEPIGFLHWLDVIPAARHSAVGAVLLAKVHDCLELTHHATAFADMQDSYAVDLLISHGYRRINPIPPRLIRSLSPAPANFDSRLFQQTDPITILDLIRRFPWLRARVAPPPKALKRLERKIRDAKPAAQRAILKEAIPGIERHFPGLAGASVDRVPSPSVPLADWTSPQSPRDQLCQDFYQSYLSIAKEMEERVRGRMPNYATEDMEVLKLYALLMFLRGRSSDAVKGVLSYFRTQGFIDKGEEKALATTSLCKQPSEAIQALSVIKPGSIRQGVQNLYAVWLKDFLQSGGIQEMPLQEITTALQDPRVVYTHMGREIPFAVFLSHPSELQEKWFSRTVQSFQPIRIQSYTSPAVVQAATRDIQDGLALRERTGEALFASYRYLDSVLALDAQEIFKHVAFPPRDATVLELGASHGTFIRRIFQKQRATSQGQGMRYIAVEVEKDADPIVRLLSSPAELKAIEFHYKDATNLDFLKDETVKAIFAKQFMNDLHVHSSDEKIVQIVEEIDRVLEQGGQLHVVDDGNTPLLTSMLFKHLGYRLTKKQVIQGTMSSGDYLLLSFTKTNPHAESVERIKTFVAGTLPACLRPVSLDPEEFARQMEIVQTAWSQIPEPDTTRYSCQLPWHMVMRVKLYLAENAWGEGLAPDDLSKIFSLLDKGELAWTEVVGGKGTKKKADARYIEAIAEAIKDVLPKEKDITVETMDAFLEAHEDLHALVNADPQAVAAVQAWLGRNRSGYQVLDLRQGFERYKGRTYGPEESIKELIVDVIQERVLLDNPVRLLPPDVADRVNDLSKMPMPKDEKGFKAMRIQIATVKQARKALEGDLEDAILGATQHIVRRYKEMVYAGRLRKTFLKAAGVSSPEILGDSDPIRALVSSINEQNSGKVIGKLKTIGPDLVSDAMVAAHCRQMLDMEHPIITREMVEEVVGRRLADLLSGRVSTKPQILKVLLMHASTNERWMTAVIGLGKGVRTGLHAIAKDTKGKPSIREAAIEALGRIGDPSSLQILSDRLDDAQHESPSLRVRAIQALAELGDPRATPALNRASKDDDPWVVLQATKALGTIAAGKTRATFRLPGGPWEQAL